MENFKILLRSLDYSTKLSLIYFSILVFLSSFLDLISIGLIIPIIEVLAQNEINEYGLTSYFLKFRFLDDSNILPTLLILFVTSIILKNILFIYINHWQLNFINRFEHKLSNNLFVSYLNKNYSFFLNKNSSEIIRNLTTEIASIIKGIKSSLYIAVEFFTIIIFFGYLILINFFITIIFSFIFLFLFFLITKFYRKKIKFWSDKRIFLNSQYLKILLQTFNSIKDIFVFKKVSEISNLHYKKKEELILLNRNFSFVNILPKPIIEILIALFIFIIIFSFKDEEYLFSYLTLYGLIFLRLYPSVTKILINFQTFAYYLPSFKTLNKDDVLKFIQIKNLKKFSISKKDFKKEISLNNIAFSYEKKEVIKNLNLKLSVGKIYGLVGDSGSGKSTLLDIIMGLKIPNSGTIQIDNKVVNPANCEWFDIIGYVPQNIYLYDDSIKENIVFFENSKDFNFKKFNEIIIKTKLNNFIENLENKSDTIIGEKATRISGGQSQRINLARAMYSDPKILILDEATSQLDENTEKEVLNTLNELKKDIIIIFVTHKKNLYKYFDEIIRLND